MNSSFGEKDDAETAFSGFDGKMEWRMSEHELSAKEAIALGRAWEVLQRAKAEASRADALFHQTAQKAAERMGITIEDYQLDLDKAAFILRENNGEPS